MTKEILKTQGIIQRVKSDKKGVQLDDGKWYASKFFKGEVTEGKGDTVNVEYVKNGEYFNLEKITLVKKAEFQTADKFTAAAEEKSQSMRESYAKDVFLTLYMAEQSKEGVKRDAVTIAQEAGICMAIIIKSLKREIEAKDDAE